MYCSYMNKKHMPHDIEYSTLNQVMACGKGALLTLDARLEAVELSAAKLWALIWTVQADAPPSLTQLAECMRSAKSNITTLIDRLEKDGLVRRVHDTGDRRSIQVEITPLGRERYAAGMAVFEQVNAELRALLDGDDLTELERLLRTINEQMRG